MTVFSLCQNLADMKSWSGNTSVSQARKWKTFLGKMIPGIHCLITTKFYIGRVDGACLYRDFFTPVSFTEIYGRHQAEKITHKLMSMTFFILAISSGCK